MYIVSDEVEVDTNFASVLHGFQLQISNNQNVSSSTKCGKFKTFYKLSKIDKDLLLRNALFLCK